MKLWPIKEDGVVRPLPALPGVIANASFSAMGV